MCKTKTTVAGAVLIAGVIGLIWCLPSLVMRVAYAAEVAKAEVATHELKATDKFSAPFEEVAAIIKPSLISITSTMKVKGASEAMPHLPDEFRHFFGDEFFQDFFHGQAPRHGYTQQALGSGVIVSDDGYILTNAHVVDNATKVQVTLSDNRKFEAKVIGRDTKTDIALLKINATGLYPAKLGNSDDVEVGQWVVAAGIPFGLSHTVTAGLISAKGRSHVGITDYEDFIQTDAPINPGNSGGPLVSLKGEVVGINTAIFTRSGGYMGIGFAIPINMAKSVMHSLKTTGKVVRGWLGVSIQPLTEDLAKSFNYKGTDGALVGDVTSDSPAAKGGMKQGDIITTYEGRKIKNPDELRSGVANTKPNTEANIVVFRDGKEVTLHITIGEMENQVATAQTSEATDKLGMTVKTLNADLANELGLHHNKGVLVTEVEPGGLAATAGIQPKDVILSVQGKPVTNVDQFREEVAKHDLEKGIRLVVQSGHSERFVFLRSES